MLRNARLLLVPLAVSACITVGGVSSASAQDGAGASRSELRARRILERHLARREFPGAVLTLRDPAGASFTITAGVADIGRASAAVDVNTPWNIGSTTKVFVSVVVLQLAQEEKLDLDAPVAPFFPDLPGASRITTRQLLQHTGGLNEYLDSDTVLGDARREWSVPELVAVAVARGPVAEPGAGYHYANTNYLLLGEIIARVTGRPWYAEVRSRILEPLGLRHTGYVGEPSAIPIGTGYVLEHKKFVEATTRWHPSLGGAAGGMYSTTADLLTFTLALFEGHLLDEQRTAEMQAFVPGEDYGYVGHAYGLGLERYTVRNLTVLGHMGTGSAQGSFIGYDPATRRAVAVQINSDVAGPAALIGAETLAEAAGKDISPPPMPSVTVGYRAFSYRPLKQVATGERLGELRVASQQTSVTYPIVANEGRTRLALSVSYERLSFGYRDVVHPLESAQSISVTAFLTQRLTDTWSLILVAAPGYADDFEGKASLDAVTSTLVGAGSYRFSDNFEAGLGVAVQNVFGEPLPLPIGALNWTISDRVWLNSILPISTELTWLPIDVLGLRAALLVSGGNYHGAERIYRVNNPQLNYSAVMAEVGARWFVLPFFQVTVHGGYTLYRRFEFSEGRDPAPGGEYKLSNGMMFGVDLGFGR